MKARPTKKGITAKEILDFKESFFAYEDLSERIRARLVTRPTTVGDVIRGLSHGNHPRITRTS